MKKIVRLSESELVSVINNILFREIEQPKKLQQIREFDEFGKPGKMCIQWFRKKDGTMITGPITNCEYLDQNGVMKPEIAKKQFGGAYNSLIIMLLCSTWQFNYLKPGVKKNDKIDLSALINSIPNKAEFNDFVNKFDERVKTYGFKPGVPRPTLGEALAVWLGVDSTNVNYDELKKHFEKIGIPMSIGKGAKNFTEIKFNSSQSACPSGYKTCSQTYTKCCVSPKIAEVQKCLGIRNPDGKWGNITQNKLKASFPELENSFKDSDIPKICSKNNKQSTSTVNKTQTTPPQPPKPKGEY